MLALRELQSAFADALLRGEPFDGDSAGTDGASVLTDLVVADGLSPAARLDIYRHHVATSLTRVLEGAYPVVCRLVDPRFFAYAADAYVRVHPPASPCLEEYGAGFADFLRDFPPCRDLAYLPDVARLEWAVHAAVHSIERPPLDPARLADVPADRLARVVLELDPSVSLLASPWPVDLVWRANQPDADGRVDVSSGGVRLRIRRADGVVGMQRVEPAEFALRTAMAHGRTLAAAAAAALATDPHADITAALRDVFAERIAVGFTVSNEQEETP